MSIGISRRLNALENKVAPRPALPPAVAVVDPRATDEDINQIYEEYIQTGGSVQQSALFSFVRGSPSQNNMVPGSTRRSIRRGGGKRR
jgi:hypothetical protein